MDIFRNERIIWQGSDSTTPQGCTLVVAEVLGLIRTYLLRDGIVLGRIETSGRVGGMSASVGANLLGGESVGFNCTSSEDAFARILTRIEQKQEA